MKSHLLDERQEVVHVSCSEVSLNQIDLLQTKARCWPTVCYENLVEDYQAKEIIN